MFLLILIPCECLFELGFIPMAVKLQPPLLGNSSVAKSGTDYLQLPSKMHIIQNFVDSSVAVGLNIKTKMMVFSQLVHKVNLISIWS